MSKKVETYYDPKTNLFPYPLETDKHYLEVKKDNGNVYDENYPYFDYSFKMKMKKFFTRVLLVLIVFPVTRIRLGLKIEGRANLKAYKDIIYQGVLSCCNHVHMWDYLGLMRAVIPHKTHVLVWDKNISGENGSMMRGVGGVPIPSNNLKGTMAYYKQVGQYLNNGGWLHIYAEGSMWEYYKPIRPLKRGVAYLARKFDKPIIPLAYSYRKPSWIRSKIFKQIACFTIHIGEPLFIDKNLPEEDQEKDLLIRLHDKMCLLAGIKPEERLYPPIFDNSKRVDYYTDTYGIGYKGSH